jgi:Domain of unknown function (DUF4386)
MNSLKSTARVTGLLYLVVAITGILGFLVIRPVLHDAADAAATAANLVRQEGLARLGIALELGIVLSQALVAVWFFRLFRSVNVVAAGSIAAFGMVNAIVILASSVALTGALAAALDPGLAPGGDSAATAQFMYALSAALWAGGSLFFGLWLIPMGYAAVVSGWMPKLLGQVLMVGGVGYVLSVFAIVLLPDAPEFVGAALTIPATVGEFWMIGYLLIFGVRPAAGDMAFTPA